MLLAEPITRGDQTRLAEFGLEDVPRALAITAEVEPGSSASRVHAKARASLGERRLDLGEKSRDIVRRSALSAAEPRRSGRRDP